MSHPVVNTKRISIAVFGVLVLSANVADAAVVFHEDFEGYTMPPGMSGSSSMSHGGGGYWSKRIDRGIPKLSEGAAEIWHGARFDGHGGSARKIDRDLSVLRSGRPHRDMKHQRTALGRFKDNAGLVFRLDTAGYEDISLEFAWRLQRTRKDSRVRAGYLTVNPGFGMCGGDGESGCYADLRHGPGAWHNWTEFTLIDHGGKKNSMRRGRPWAYEHFMLPAGESELWVAFWLDGGHRGFGNIDNIMVNATAVVIPLPASVWLLASVLGIMGFRVRNPRA